MKGNYKSPEQEANATEDTADSLPKVAILTNTVNKRVKPATCTGWYEGTVASLKNKRDGRFSLQAADHIR